MLFRSQAAEDRRRRLMVEERIRYEHASEDERRWLRDVIEDEAAAREIVDRGRIVRQQKQDGVAA